MWIAGVAGAILFVAVIMASMILGGGDSGSVSATVASQEPATTAAPELSARPAPPRAPPPHTVAARRDRHHGHPDRRDAGPAPTRAARPAGRSPAAGGRTGHRHLPVTGNRALLDWSR